MKAIIKKLNIFLYTALCVAVFLSGAALAQGGNETETAAESQLFQVMLPPAAQRINQQSVPAEINALLDKVVAAGGGKFQKGEAEFLLWSGAGYKKADATNIVNRFAGAVKSAGWKYSLEGEEQGVTIFTALQETPRRRAVVGFYGATDEALIVGAMEILPNNGAAINAPTATDNSEKPAGNNNGGIVGTWTNGAMGTIGEKYQNGTVAARRGTTFKYVFHPNGAFEFTGYAESTMYGCTTSLFQDKRGKYQITGAQITLTLSKNFWRNQYSCSPASNKERDYTLGTETYALSRKTDEYGKSLVCLTNDKGESCYRRED